VISLAAATVSTVLIVMHVGGGRSDAADVADPPGATATTTLTSEPDGSAKRAGSPVAEVAQPTGSRVSGVSGTVTTRPAAVPTTTPSQSATGSTTFNTVGGSVLAVCLGPLVYLADWAAAAGYSVHRVERGPADRAEVQFQSTQSQVRIVVRCDGGKPQERTTSSPRPRSSVRAT
jgi:hypothetical protein